MIEAASTSRHASQSLHATRSLAECVRLNSRLDASQLITKIRTSVAAFSNSETFADDLTCVVVKIEERKLPLTCSEIEISATLLHGGFARRVLTSRRLRSCYSSEYRTPELVHPVEGLDGNCNFSRTTGIVA